MRLLVGTAKGLIIWQKNNHNWFISHTHFTGFPVSMVYIDERTNTWWVGLPHRHWGQKLYKSLNEGTTWQQVSTPRYPTNIPLKSGKTASLRLIWCMAQAGKNRPNELWLGTEPGGLFHSKDNGDTWQLVTSLWQHRVESDLWFGAGKDEPFIHSIVINPEDSNHVYIAVSCAGVYETTNYGETWQPRNVGLKATYLPSPDVEVGHDPHRLLICETDPSVLWQQNHCGIFRSVNAAKTWKDVTDKKGFANYGFALTIDHKNPQKAWVIPAQSDEIRVPHDLALCVCRTDDGGNTWLQLRDGLPQNHCYDIVFRHAFDKKNHNLAFGTTTGNLFLSENEGDNWQCLSTNLPRIDSVLFSITN
jgi:photosystem II stability/assembly factor-like uncharacterized protein